MTCTLILMYLVHYVGTAKSKLFPEEAPLFVTPVLYADPPDDTLISNGCEIHLNY